MKTEKVFVEVDMKDEVPPDKCDCYFTMLKHEGESTIYSAHLWNFNGKAGWDEEEEYVPPTHWLKEVEYSQFKQIKPKNISLFGHKIDVYEFVKWILVIIMAIATICWWIDILTS